MGFSSYSQDISYHYKKGPSILNKELRYIIKIPVNDPSITGIGIIEFQVDSLGQMKGKILSTLNDYTTKNYLEIFDKIKDGWKKTGTPYNYRLTIKYNLDYNELSNVEIQVPGFSQLLQKFSDGGSVTVTHFKDQSSFLPKFKLEKTTIAQQVVEGNIDVAYEKTNKLLRYIPIDSELIELRIQLEKELGISKFTPFDQNMISTFERMIVESQKAPKGPQGLDTLYLGGMSAYNKQLRESLIYPASSIKMKNQGTVIYSISVDTSAVVSAKIFTLIDKEIEAAVIEAVNRTSNNWIASKNPYTLYQAITFCDSDVFLEERPNFVAIDVTELGYPMLSHVYKYSGIKSVTAEKRSLGYTRTPVSSSKQLNNPQSRLSSSTVSKTRIGYTPNFRKIKSRLERAASKEKSEQEFELLSELIRYDPLNKEYIQRRYELSKSLNDPRFRSYDLAWFKAMNKLLANK